MPQATYADVRRVAHVAHEVLDELGAVGWPKTVGRQGHAHLRAHRPDWGWADVRRAAHAFAREVERRSAGLVDLTWWRKDRDPASIFVDWNQNTRDHTIRCAYSVRGVAGGTGVDADPLGRDRRRASPATSRSRRCRRGSPSWATCTRASTTRCSRLDELLEWADRDAARGRGAPAEEEPQDLDA